MDANSTGEYDHALELGQKALLEAKWGAADAHFHDALKIAQALAKAAQIKDAGWQIGAERQTTAILFLAISAFKQERIKEAGKYLARARAFNPPASITEKFDQLERAMARYISDLAESKDIRNEIRAYKKGVQAFEREEWPNAIKHFEQTIKAFYAPAKQALLTKFIPHDQCILFLAISYFKSENDEQALYWATHFEQSYSQSAMAPQIEGLKAAVKMRKKLRPQIAEITAGENALKRREWAEARHHFQTVRLANLPDSARKHLNHVISPVTLLFYEASAYWGEIMEELKDSEAIRSGGDRRRILSLRKELKECQTLIKKAKESAAQENSTSEILSQLKALDKQCKDVLARVR